MINGWMKTNSNSRMVKTVVVIFLALITNSYTIDKKIKKKAKRQGDNSRASGKEKCNISIFTENLKNLDVVDHNKVASNWSKHSSSMVIMDDDEDTRTFGVKTKMDLKRRFIGIYIEDENILSYDYRLKELEKGLHELKIFFDCKEIGGGLSKVLVSVDLKDCFKKIDFMFQKKCGDPNLPRPNLSMNVTQEGRNVQIVKNGLDSGKKIFKFSGEKKTSLLISTTSIEDEKCIWRRKTRLGFPRLEFDPKFLKPRIITYLNRTEDIALTEKEPLNLDLDFGCKGKEGKNNITVEIKMRYFRDIMLNLEVSCEGNLRKRVTIFIIEIIKFLVLLTLWTFSTYYLFQICLNQCFGENILPQIDFKKLYELLSSLSPFSGNPNIIYMETPEEVTSLVKNELQAKPVYHVDETEEDLSSIDLSGFRRSKGRIELNRSKNMELNQEILL